MIEKAKGLNKGSREILLAYLHFLHMLEHLHHHDPQYHWLGRRVPAAHWV